MDRVEGKVALVTGGAQGIGQAITMALAQEGADICVADKNYNGAKITAGEVEKLGRESMAIEVDIARLSDLDKMVTSTIDRFGHIDILVNNAGVYFMRPVMEITEADWDIIINVNLKGLFFTTQCVLPHMIKQGKGKIINIASNMGATGHSNLTVYCASKGGVVNLTRALAVELAPMKINVNAIGPALTQTPTTQPDIDNPELLKCALEEIPLGKLGQPGDIAAAAVYLASDESDFVTGHTLYVDGGFTSQ